MAVLLVGFGGPNSMEEVRPFLDNVLKGRPVPPERYEEVVRQYEAVGGASPYNRQTFDFAEKLERRLDREGCPLPVYVGLRHTRPTFAETLERMAADGISEAAGVILSSFRSEPSWDRYVEAVEEARAGVPGAPVVRPLAPWNDDDLFIQALTDRVREGEASIPEDGRRDAHWLFTAHSVPVEEDRRSGYADQARRAAARAAEALGHENWSLCFQSRTGRPEQAWLEPDVGDAIASLDLSRSREVLVIPAGFLTDHMEVIFDLDVKARRRAEAARFAFHRARTVGDHPAFLELLTSRVRQATISPGIDISQRRAGTL